MAEALAWSKKKYKLVLGPLRKAVQRQCQQRSEVVVVLAGTLED